MRKVAVVVPEEALEGYEERCLDDSLSHGETPLTTSSVHPSVMTDWLSSADLIAVYLDYGLTMNMDSDMVKLQAYGIPVEYRRINKEV